MEVRMPEQRIGKTYRVTAGAHREIEWFALVCDTEPGVILEQMTASLGHRVDKLRKELGLPHGNLEGTLIQMLLLKDVNILSEREFQQQVDEIKSWKDDVEWYGVEECERRARAEAETDNRK
jgi:hypothetical protein